MAARSSGTNGRSTTIVNPGPGPVGLPLRVQARVYSPSGDVGTVQLLIDGVAAAVDGELRELTYPVKMDATVRPISMAHPDGALIYRRSLNFLLEMAFTDLFPGGSVRIDHSISFGGYYCQVSGRGPLSEAELAALKSHMQQLIDTNMPFERKEVPLQEAIEYFKSIGYDDKVRLLKYRRGRAPCAAPADAPAGGHAQREDRIARRGELVHELEGGRTPIE